MIKKITPHIRFHHCTHNVSHGGSVIVCRRVNDAENYVKTAATEYKARCQQTYIALRRPGDLFDNKRQHKLAKRCERRAKHIKKEYALVFGIIGDKSAYYSFFARTFFDLIFCHGYNLSVL